MKKSFKSSVCKALTTAACATLLVAGALGFNSISAKAATKSWSIDLSNGKTVGFTQEDLKGITEPFQIPKGYTDAYVAFFTMAVYDPNFVITNPDVRHATSVLSTNPYQGLVMDQPNNDTVQISAMPGSVGTGKYILNKKVIMQNPEFSEGNAYMIMLLLDELTGGDAIKNLNQVDKQALDAMEIVVEIKYSDVPVIANHSVVNGAPAVTFEVGKQFESNGINYRVMDAAGNLSATDVTSDSKKVVIPDSVNLAGYSLNVTEIAQRFMKGNKKVKSVTIGSNVTSIGSEAFYKCKKLKKVSVKSTKVASIGMKAFGKDAKGFTLKMPKSCKKSYKKLLKKAKVKL